MSDDPDFTATLERFSGFGAHYDGVRPSPPSALGDLLCSMARCSVPGLVVDLGCGTGLSTRYWANRARGVIGVEPTDAMRVQAEQTKLANVSYRKGYSHATGLDDGCADLVVCAQSLHWMDPLPTFREIARILRPGGVFAAYDYDWPPATSSWEVDLAYTECMELGRRLERERGVSAGLRQWEKSGHLSRMQESGCFRYVREVAMHHHDEGDAGRIVGLLLSQGYVQSLLKAGLGEEDLRIDHLRAIALRELGTSPAPWFWSARVRLAVK